MSASRTCLRCRQALSEGVAFCASCGFDNGEEQRLQKALSFDEQIASRFWWMRFRYVLARYFCGGSAERTSSLLLRDAVPRD